MPNDGTGSQWDETHPAGTDIAKNGIIEIPDLRIGARLRLSKEHVLPVAGTITTGNLGSTGGGEHKAGSAFPYISHTAPTLRPDGVTALGASDKGRLWCDETVSPPILYQWSGSTWVQVSVGSVKVATIKDIKAAGSAGGTSVSGAWTTRTLQTLIDPSSIVTSLAANIITLPAGTYHITASAPAFNSDNHQLRLNNTTDAVYTYGSTGYSSSAAGGAATTSHSLVSLITTYAGAKALKLEHIVRTSKVTDGFGPATDATWAGYTANGRAEVFSIVTIVKI